MPTAELSFEVSAPPSTVARLLQDLDVLASINAGVVGVQRLSPTVALWTIRLQFGPIARNSEYRGELLRATDDRIEFRAEGPEAYVSGRIALAPSGPARSILTVHLDAHGRGALARVADSLLEQRLPADLRSFAERLTRRFAGTRAA
ncbi:MAG TPA: SRPBCC family protein [Thermoplasmata archaeon]|nr:SRPBCC family protein [Thermoplasmata archaeon]